MFVLPKIFLHTIFYIEFSTNVKYFSTHDIVQKWTAVGNV